MKLLILATYYTPDVNAASIRLNNIVKRIYQTNSNTKIRVITFDPLYKFTRESADIVESAEVHRYIRKILPTSIFMPQSLNPLTLISWIYITLREIAKYDPNLILVTTPPFTPAISLYLISKITGKKFTYIVDYRDDLTAVISRIADTKRFYVKYLLKTANRFMSYLLYCSLKQASLISTVDNILQKKLLKTNKKVILVPNGLDVQELNRIMRNFDKEDILRKNGIQDIHSKIIIYLGDLNMPYYSPEVILEPMNKLNAEGYNLIYLIIGEGSHRETIRREAKKLDMENSVYFLGRKQHHEAMELLLASDIAFYSLQKDDPQAKHAIGTKVYEYVGCKLPILAIADDNSAISKFVETKDIGVFVTWKERDKIKCALKDLIDSKRYVANIEKNYQFFIDSFDRNKGIDLLYENIKALYEFES